MIVRNDREQWIGCDICEEITELSRRVLANSETVLLMVEELTRDHRDCEEYKHNPRQAQLQRGFKVRMRNEMSRAAGKLTLRG